MKTPTMPPPMITASAVGGRLGLESTSFSGAGMWTSLERETGSKSFRMRGPKRIFYLFDAPHRNPLGAALPTIVLSKTSFMPMDKQSLVALDRQHLIHPVSNLRAHERRGPTVLESGHGAYLRDIDGRELLDAFSGLWCVNIGYGQESVVRAATEQMRKLPYATGYFDFASEPAIRLAAKLVEISPASLQHVYFTLGGSDAVDSAIRLITQYYNATGKPQKKQFISLQRGYHGSSSVGAGLTAIPAFHANFDLPLPTQHYIPSPYPYRNPETQPPGPGQRIGQGAAR